MSFLLFNKNKDLIEKDNKFSYNMNRKRKKYGAVKNRKTICYTLL